MLESNLLEIVEMFRKVAFIDIFERDVNFKSILMDIAKNIISVNQDLWDQRGKRYSKSTIILFEMILNFGSLISHGFVSANLMSPSLRTSKSLYKK